MRARRLVRPCGVGLVGAGLLGLGCTAREGGNDLSDPAAPAPVATATDQLIQDQLNAIVSAAETRYGALHYEYNEGLLQIVDQVTAALIAQPPGATRFLPNLDEAEERDHFRAVIQRWEEQTGQNLRAAIAPLVAEVAGRQPGEGFHPDFQKRCSVLFDSFVPIEVADIHDRRNRAIHRQTEPVLAPYRATNPEIARRYEAMLNAQYPLRTASRVSPQP